jgi:hypothetical protein
MVYKVVSDPRIISILLQTPHVEPPLAIQTVNACHSLSAQLSSPLDDTTGLLNVSSHEARFTNMEQKAKKARKKKKTSAKKPSGSRLANGSLGYFRVKTTQELAVSSGFP